jgi:hypothetical protein
MSSSGSGCHPLDDFDVLAYFKESAPKVERLALAESSHRGVYVSDAEAGLWGGAFTLGQRVFLSVGTNFTSATAAAKAVDRATLAICSPRSTNFKPQATAGSYRHILVDYRRDLVSAVLELEAQGLARRMPWADVMRLTTVLL